MQLADISVVVSTHDAGPALLPMLQELLRKPFASVLVVDSGSSDGSIAQVKEALPGLHVARLGENLGPCATRNRGLLEARTPFVLFLDDDMRLQEGCALLLKKALLEDPRRALAGPRILHLEQPDAIQYEGGFWNYAGLPHMRGQGGESLPEGNTRVDVLTAGCLLGRRPALLEAGGFDATFFYLMEDVELSLRLRYLGWELVAVSAARAFNAGGSQGLSLEGERYPARRVFLHARNRCLLLLGLYERSTLFLLWPGLFLLDLAWLCFALRKGHLAPYLRGKLNLLKFLPALGRKRRALSPRKQQRDRHLLGCPPLSFSGTPGNRFVAPLLGRLLNSMLYQLWCLGRGFLP